ncbi:MAG: hypothetical protein A2131_00495 [Candidatus Sungbacteria bacterium GWC2_49_10]|uniref:Probable DNA 3'-5' helicase RecG n=2 Tax=Parcubacteria group TaxID=1794811 RepID=A0A1G2K151_9BACT|nr:MAG: hypothetical protein A2131_00495 [Candidatus Sungbacteria bacterium GWC2_49_10]
MPILLNTPIESAARVHRRIIPALKRLGIRTLRDLLFHFPLRYDDFSNEKDIAGIFPGETVTVRGVIEKVSLHRTFRKKMALTEAVLRDETGKIKAVWFNQPFLAKNLKEGFLVRLSGKVAKGPGGAYLQNPSYERVGASARAIHTGGLVAVYPETRGITSRWLRYLISNSIPLRKNLVDPIPLDILKRNNLPWLSEALFLIHFPKTKEEARAAERRFVFEDLLMIQLRALQERSRLKEKRAPEIPLDIPLVKKFVTSLPFALTDAQRRSLWEIANDLVKPSPMNRLLEGDVGSGKTVVAAAAALLTVKAGYRAVFMAPTEILARQHFATLGKLLKPFSMSLGFRTGTEKRATDSDVVVGTHALIQKGISFENLGLVVVDEQHRFGVNQRQALVRGHTRTEETRTDADELHGYLLNEGIATGRDKLLYEDITYKIRGSVFQVKDEIGLGHKESVYQKALAEAFRIAGLRFTQEKRIDVFFRGKKVGIYQPDFIIEDQVLIELKALPFVGSTELKQIWQYAKGSPYKLALLINFGPQGVAIERMVYDTARSPRESAIEKSPRTSALWIPHFLSMSATPIPRTLALSIYGDLDLSILDEMPKSRKPVATEIVEPAKRESTYQFIREEVKKGRQVFVICPRIETPSTNNESVTNIRMSELQKRIWEVKAVKEEYQKLSTNIFPDLKVAMLHGKMPAKSHTAFRRVRRNAQALGGKSKEEVMKDFRDGKIDILVSTSVVEVGVDIPNASVMMIEGAERFGLAQLHQFRGRVGRGAEQSYCFLFPTEDGAASRRLRAVRDAKSGFELAEKDLEIRGPGNMFGVEQSGFSQHALKGIMDAELVRAVRREAIELLRADPGLRNNSTLAQRIKEMESEVHWE